MCLFSVTLITLLHTKNKQLGSYLPKTLFISNCSAYKVKDPDENIANDVDDEAGLFVALWLVWCISAVVDTLLQH